MLTLLTWPASSVSLTLQNANSLLINLLSATNTNCYSRNQDLNISAKIEEAATSTFTLFQRWARNDLPIQLVPNLELVHQEKKSRTRSDSNGNEDSSKFKTKKQRKVNKIKKLSNDESP